MQQVAVAPQQVVARAIIMPSLSKLHMMLLLQHVNIWKMLTKIYQRYIHI